MSPSLAIRLIASSQARYVDESSIELTDQGAVAMRQPVMAVEAFNVMRRIGTCIEEEDVHPVLPTFGWQLDAMGA